jgi:drug/metabolite transporter (DMT)-like permease
MAPTAEQPARTAPAWQIWAALLAIYVIWGSTYLGIRVMVETMPPFLAAGIRFGIAGVILGLLLVLRGGPARLRISRSELIGSAVVAFLLLCLGNGLVTLGEQSVQSGLAALVVGVVPLMVLAIRRVLGETVPGTTLIGVVVGFVGLAVLMIPGGIDGSVDVTGMVVLIVASFSWSVGSFMSKRISLPRDPLVSTTYQLLLGGLMLLAVALPLGEWRVDAATFSLPSLIAMVYLITAGSLVGYTAYTWLLQHAPISRVATYAYVNPVVAVVLGGLILNEQITITAAIGAVLIVASVAFTIWTESAARRHALSTAGVAVESRSTG